MKDVALFYLFWGGCHFSIMFPSIFDNKKKAWDPKKNEARGGFKKQQDIDFCCKHMNVLISCASILLCSYQWIKLHL